MKSYNKTTKILLISTQFVLSIYCMELSNVINAYKARCGGNTLCELQVTDWMNNTLRDYCPECSCETTCIFSRNCCPNLYLRFPQVCIETSIVNANPYHDKKREVAMIGNCPVSSNNVTKTKCEISTSFDQKLQNIPVYSSISGLSYRNVHCSVCHNESNIIQWKIEIECAKFADFNFLSSYSEIIDHARMKECDIFYSSSDIDGADINTCDGTYLYGSVISKCNVSGTWILFDASIDFACRMNENIFRCFKNVFCHLCNPPKSGFGFTTCDQFYLSTIGHSPPIAPTFRILFEFSNNKQPSTHNKETPRCNSSQIVFLNECRDIHCYPGRILVDTGCTPLFQPTENLGYILYGTLKASLLNNVNDSMPFLESVSESFKEYIKKCLRLSDINFKTSICISNLYCPRNQLNKLYKGLNVLILVYHKLFITESVNRSRTEEQLLSLFGSTFNITYDDFEQPFLFKHDVKAFQLPSVVSKMNFTDKCYINETFRSYPGHSYVHARVNQLLVCEQIELNEDEFSVNLKDLKLTIFSRNTDIEQDDYMVMSTRKARLCVNRLQTLNTQKDSYNSAVVWNTVALVFTCISLVCLGLTFFTYCFFSSLRTLPGKNNMCLVFAMFCGQFVFQFVELGAKSDIGCKVIGVLIHYFWLVTFGCLNVCSFHMFFVFTSKTGIHISETSRLAVYILYSYWIPAIVVVLNIIITRSLSSVTLIGYGGHVCFLSEQVAFYVTFLIPISLVCFSNIFFFIGTAFKIARRPKLNNDSQMSLNRIQFSVYVKLFSITGISWIFQIIDSFIPFSAFSTIVSLLNALQGVFIFISYVCNRRVLNLYKQTRMSLSENSNSKTSRHTTSTELSGK